MTDRPVAAALAISAIAAICAGGLLLLGQEVLGQILLAATAVAAWLGAWLSIRSGSRYRARVSLLEEAERRRADQSSVLSHEIRTPLAVIQGAAELLAERLPGPLNEQQEVFVTRILDNAVRMHTFSEQLLTRARLDAGLISLSRSSVDLRVLLRTVIEDLSQVLEPRIVLEAPGAPVSAVVDGQVIRQVVTNLVNNAARSALSVDSIEVRLIAGDGEAIISVSDGGSGMSEQQRARLFSRFSSGRPIGDGTGIGLFISQQFIQLHGGRVYVDTITGKGTTMMFTLPLASAGSSTRGHS